MTSCGGTSSTTVRSETLIIVSNGQKMKHQARPLGLRRQPAEPERHGALVLLEDVHPVEEQEDRDEDDDDEAVFHGVSSPFPCKVRRRNSPARTHRQGKIADCHHLHRLARRHRLLGDRVPELAVDEHLAPGRPRAERASARPRGPAPRRRCAPACAGPAGPERQEADHQQRECREHGDQLHAHPQRRLRRLEQHQRAQHQARSTPATVSMP